MCGTTGPVIFQPVEPIIVIGAGAAGLMAAIFAAGQGRPVLVLERTRDGGRKILISGGGRCNILPSTLDPARFVSDSSRHLLRRMLLAWPLEAQRRFFEEQLRLPLVLEPETGKLFPAGNRARDVRDGLIGYARQQGVEFRFEQLVRDFSPSGSGWTVDLESGSLAASAIVLATGGLSVPNTGSDGVGLEVARRLGHAIHPPYPALTPLTAHPAVHAPLSGLSLEVTIAARVEGKRVASRGGFLFTHHGYSGPAVLDLSHLAVRSRLEGGPRQELLVQWCGVNQEEWQRRLRERSPRQVLTLLRDELPGRLAEQLLRESGIEAGRQLAQLTREERRELVERLVRYPLPWTGDEGYRKAEVTGGGVALAEMNPATLESRRHAGLYFSGEILDAFGPIGGYNFAWAWSTGRTAGRAAGQAKGVDPEAHPSNS
jgi:predicted Rossmann fold flavoprotein